MLPIVYTVHSIIMPQVGLRQYSILQYQCISSTVTQEQICYTTTSGQRWDPTLLDLPPPLEEFRMASPSSRDGSLPVPISLTIYNRLPPHTEETASTATATATVTSNKKWFRPDYTVGLLVSVRLEIVVKDEEEDEEHTVYSSTIDSDQSTIHPVWDHLNERVPFNPEGWEVYSKSTFARIILPNNNTILVDYVPLHPNSLRRLPKDDCNDSYTNSTPSPPSSLPPNAVLIHYSDGLVRVESALYHALLKQHVIEEANPRDFSLIQDDDEENKQRSRFEDNVFDILGKVENTITPSVSVITSSSLLETDNEALATPIRTVQEGDFDDEDSLTTSRIPTTEGEARLQDLQSDHDTLLAQLEAEELLLKAEEEALNSQAKYLQSTVQIVSDLEEETTQIRRATTQIL